MRSCSRPERGRKVSIPLPDPTRSAPTPEEDRKTKGKQCTRARRGSQRRRPRTICDPDCHHERRHVHQAGSSTGKARQKDRRHVRPHPRPPGVQGHATDGQLPSHVQRSADGHNHLWTLHTGTEGPHHNDDDPAPEDRTS